MGGMGPRSGWISPGDDKIPERLSFLRPSSPNPGGKSGRGPDSGSILEVVGVVCKSNWPCVVCLLVCTLLPCSSNPLGSCGRAAELD